jgi:hypothetical protein
MVERLKVELKLAKQPSLLQFIAAKIAPRLRLSNRQELVTRPRDLATIPVSFDRPTLPGRSIAAGRARG